MMRLLTHSGKASFKARSAQRDLETDKARVRSIANSIKDSIKSAEAEHAGLSVRLQDVLARAAVTFGSGSDEYLGREPLDNHHQDLFSLDIVNAERRIAELATTIGHLRCLNKALVTRFPTFDL
uniref:Uncharacterized protein n=1 Tax=Rhodopseudomonas palustris (strain BisA53) TaxID=316055 RepID=Q07SK8_RHOP5